MWFFNMCSYQEGGVGSKRGDPFFSTRQIGAECLGWSRSYNTCEEHLDMLHLNSLSFDSWEKKLELFFRAEIILLSFFIDLGHAWHDGSLHSALQCSLVVNSDLRCGAVLYDRKKSG